MERIEFNVSTGERKVIQLTPAEIADAVARTAAEAKLLPLRRITETENSNPITHRALREFFIGFGELHPEFKVTPLYKRVKAVDDMIAADRAVL
jgi:hypothetical protein